MREDGGRAPTLDVVATVRGKRSGRCPLNAALSGQSSLQVARFDFTRVAVLPSPPAPPAARAATVPWPTPAPASWAGRHQSHGRSCRAEEHKSEMDQLWAGRRVVFGAAHGRSSALRLLIIEMWRADGSRLRTSVARLPPATQHARHADDQEACTGCTMPNTTPAASHL